MDLEGKFKLYMLYMLQLNSASLIFKGSLQLVTISGVGWFQEEKNPTLRLKKKGQKEKKEK